jgi:hypothetical protein
MMTWLLAHLEEYHTGQLMYSNGWLGVLEANYSLAILSFCSFIFGEQVRVGLSRSTHAMESCLGMRHLRRCMANATDVLVSVLLLCKRKKAR